MITILRGTGPLKMWHAYCDRCGRRVVSRNTRRGAALGAVKHNHQGETK